jgi:hypothetical protein
MTDLTKHLDVRDLVKGLDDVTRKSVAQLKNAKLNATADNCAIETQGVDRGTVIKRSRNFDGGSDNSFESSSKL